MPAFPIRALGLAALASSPVSAQTPFSTRVVEVGTTTAVRSDIEYETGPDSWRLIKPTNQSGQLSDHCPGPGRIRANPTPYVFHYKISQPAPCGGTVPFSVERRELSDIFHGDTGYAEGLTRTAFAQAYLEGLLKSGAAPARTEAEAVLLRSYAANGERLSAEERQRIETLILNQSAGAFNAVDVDSDSRLTGREIRAAMSRRD